jgi:hypothetical protein
MNETNYLKKKGLIETKYSTLIDKAQTKIGDLMLQTADLSMERDQKLFDLEEFYFAEKELARLTAIVAKGEPADVA